MVMGVVDGGSVDTETTVSNELFGGGLCIVLVVGGVVAHYVRTECFQHCYTEHLGGRDDGK